MDDQVRRLVDKAWKRFQDVPQDQRFMIAISGIPGSGKTTLSQTVTNELNRLHQAQYPGAEPVAAFCPMDGYHLTREQLSAMPDPANAHARRGAEFTFDGPAFLALVKALRKPLPLAGAGGSEETSTIFAPSFDHAVKDPKENDIPLRGHHRIVVFEGNYVCLDQEPWREAAGLMDERWFVEVDFDVARARLVRRHVKAGIAADEEAAGRRADENDLVNGRQVVENKVQIDEVVYSREDQSWKHE
ncbi:P-loop containing nucleoside triphosphate hydrolase protein [Microdochium bolleyi]|uniref:p-loop containing nucleoside triphosphate hydrolase protein n=1 Tax=Microdochium bolleyi TaxID=196109 RepID=A0A136IRP8_9PEZI|nr:P-loop containing nucleoside triphosphate hydrolase protein [Microdochium bolleyi]